MSEQIKDQENNKDDNENKSEFEVEVIEEEKKEEIKEENKEEEKEEIKEEKKEEIKEEKIIEKNNKNLNNKITDTNVIEIDTSPKKIDIQIEKTGNENFDLFINKVNYFNKIYNLTLNFANIIINQIRKISEPFYIKISNSYLKEIKPQIKYLDRIAYTYTGMMLEMKKINFDASKTVAQIYGYYLIGEDAPNIVHKTNIILDESFKNISSEIKKQIFNNVNHSKIDSVPTKLDFFYKKLLSLINEFEHKKKEYENYYVKNYNNQFNKFLNQIKAPDLDIILQNFTDYSIVEYSLISSSNQMFDNINHFINEIKNTIKTLKDIIFDYIELLKHNMEIYHNQIVKIFNFNLYKSYGNYDKFINNCSKETVDLKLSVKQLLGNKNNEHLLKEFNELFIQLQENLLNNNLSNDKMVEDRNNFNAEKYNSLEEYINFLLQIIPKKIEINYKDLIKFQLNIKRSAGVFKGFKNATIIVTYQGHIIIFDNENNKNEELMKNKIIFIYNKSKVSIRKRQSKKSNFYLSIWENTNNKKKIKNLILDTLNEEYLNEIIKNVGGLIEGLEKEEEEEKKESEK